MTDRLWLIHQPILENALIARAEADYTRASWKPWPEKVLPENRHLNLNDVQANKTPHKLTTIYKLIVLGLDTPGAIAEALNIEGNMAFYDNRVDH